MSDNSLETIHPWISTHIPRSRQISLPKPLQEAGSSSELWAVRIPTGVNAEMLQSSKWEKQSQDLGPGGMIWTTSIEGTTYYLEEVSMNSPHYAINQSSSALMSPVVRQLMIYADKSGNSSDQPRESKKKRNK